MKRCSFTTVQYTIPQSESLQTQYSSVHSHCNSVLSFSLHIHSPSPYLSHNTPSPHPPTQSSLHPTLQPTLLTPPSHPPSPSPHPPPQSPTRPPTILLTPPSHTPSLHPPTNPSPHPILPHTLTLTPPSHTPSPSPHPPTHPHPLPTLPCTLTYVDGSLPSISSDHLHLDSSPVQVLYGFGHALPGWVHHPNHALQRQLTQSTPTGHGYHCKMYVCTRERSTFPISSGPWKMFA